MDMFNRVVLMLAASLLSLTLQAGDYAAVKNVGSVATVHPLATEAGMDALARGGNAVDAAVAAALTLGVVDGHNSGIGGGCFVVIRWADGRLEAIDGREMAPAAAHRDMYVRNGVADTALSKTGPLAIGVPGSVAAFEYLMQEGGRLKFSEVLLPAAALAEEGFAIDGIYARRLQRQQQKLQRFSGTAAVLLDAKGQPWPAGHRLVQKDLAKTYRGIASEGADYFYRGAFAESIDKWMASAGGIVTQADFANYQLKKRQPVISHYRGYTIVGFPPPSSGGVHVAQILNILEYFDLAAMSEVDRYHTVGEAMKLAFADRAHWLGDPDFVKVPRGLIDTDYAKTLSKKISTDKVVEVLSHGTPPRAELDLFGKHTTHIATADSAGNWVAITTTVNTDFGSKVIIPGTGVVMNNQMDDFSSQPGVPNAYGLVGAESNSVQPGKRPLSSMSPTIVLKDNKPVMTLGAAGGPTIITQVVQALVNHLDLEKPLYEAVATPRVHHQWKPAQLYVEKSMAPEVRSALEAKGHKTKTMGPYGSTQAIVLDGKGNFVSVAEPRLKERNKL